LREAAFDGFTLGGGNNAWQQIVGKYTVSSLLASINREGDARKDLLNFNPGAMTTSFFLAIVQIETFDLNGGEKALKLRCE
jgi:hypothetical protein